MTRLTLAQHTQSITPQITHALDRAKGLTTFAGDIFRLALAWTLPFIAFRTAESVAAAVAPEMVPEIAGGSLILSLGAVVFLVVVPLRKPIKRVLRWCLDEGVSLASYHLIN